MNWFPLHSPIAWNHKIIVCHCHFCGRRRSVVTGVNALLHFDFPHWKDLK